MAARLRSRALLALVTLALLAVSGVTMADAAFHTHAGDGATECAPCRILHAGVAMDLGTPTLGLALDRSLLVVIRTAHPPLPGAARTSPGRAPPLA
jgi:hypothetical protein